MNILTFDIEEWYMEKLFWGGRSYKYQQFDEAFNQVLDELDSRGIKATFFCVGQLAVEFPDVVKKIALKGHEIGCHSNIHTWLNKMDEETFRKDTQDALNAIEDLIGKKVTSYRAPAFSITHQNKWAVNVLADCGIENDASIFPTTRDFGGYKGFPLDTPCVICHEGATLKEYPISLTSILGKNIAYSGGGYFRFLPYWLINRTIRERDYTICYFHIRDLLKENSRFLTKKEYEDYFKEPGTLKRRLLRYAKSNAGRGNTINKLFDLLSEHEFVNIKETTNRIDWQNKETIFL